MADKPASERTEEATPERLRKAREEGQIPRTEEVPSAIMIAALLLSLGMMGGGLYRWSAEQIRRGMAGGDGGRIGPVGLVASLRAEAGSALAVTVPFLIVAAAASVLSSLLSSGWAFSPKALQVKFERISPVRGFGQLFSGRSVVKLLISLAKLTAIVWVSWAFLSDRLAVLAALRWATPEGMIALTGQLVFGLMVRVGLVILVVAGIDLLYQRRKHKKDLRMTRQEVKEERKQYELSPEVRGRIRGLQIEMARKRMLQDVPTADVVLANPTHVAVALRYDTAKMNAPVVVAKGGDMMCEKIKEIARAHNVPVVHRPELARALFVVAEVGKPIPETLFVAVAEVLAMIYRLRKRRLGV